MIILESIEAYRNSSGSHYLIKHQAINEFLGANILVNCETKCTTRNHAHLWLEHLFSSAGDELPAASAETVLDSLELSE